jgi:hypothetical protein
VCIPEKIEEEHQQLLAEACIVSARARLRACVFAYTLARPYGFGLRTVVCACTVVRACMLVVAYARVAMRAYDPSPPLHRVRSWSC